MADQTRHKHHILPEFYLKGFADANESKFTWVYTKNKPYNPGRQHYKRYSPCLTSTGIAGSEKDFYSNELSDGTIDFDGVERKLEQLEIPSQPIIRKIRNFELISDDERLLLADYVMHLYKRTKYFRSDPYNRLVAVIDESIDNHKKPEAIHKLAEVHNISITEAEQALEFYRQKYKGEGKKRIYNEIIFQPFDTMLNGLIEMNWVFLYRKGIRHSPFVTSDAPVYFSRKHGFIPSCRQAGNEL